MNGSEYLDLYIIPNTTRIVYYDTTGHSNGSWKDA